ncbi:MAG TPA: CHRD domain-containing protein [Anaeromyxobacteraceae bacterium]|nr:CHRD domain-containing protein [Anaeromyxobacteraceae bacterium]
MTARRGRPPDPSRSDGRCGPCPAERASSAGDPPRAVTTTAFGAAAFAVDSSTGQVSGFFATSGLVNPTLAHVHTGARGAPGGVLVPLGP